MLIRMYKKKTLLQHIALKKRSFVLINIWFVIASILTLTFKFTFTLYIILFALPPIIFLYSKLPRANSIIITVFSFVATLAFVISLDIIAHQTGAWIIYGSSGIKLFNTTTFIDNFIWGVLYAILILSAYEYYFDRHRKLLHKKRFIFILAFVSFLGTGIFLSLFFINYDFIEYSYLIITVGLISLTTIFVLFDDPKLVKKIILFGFCGLIPSLIYDYTAISNNHWIFTPTKHIIYFNLNGYNYPLEEILWLFFFVTVILFFYEIFADDNH